MSSLSVAVVGATGLVGTTLLALLEEKNFPLKSLHLVASQHSAGKAMRFRGEMYSVQDLAHFDFHQTQLAFFCVGNELAAEYAPKATSAGNVVIDKSFYFRKHDDVPLIIPEVNADEIAGFRKKNLIANPNCNTIPIAVGVKPIYDAVGITRMNVCTYQSVSGTGKDAVTELWQQTRKILDDQPIEPRIYPQQIAFNVLPQIDDFMENGYTREEMKIIWEIQKIFKDKSLLVNPTAVRVPVFCGHAASVHLETSEKITTAQAEKLLSQAPGIHLMTGHLYPTPARDAAGKDSVYIGRVREDISHPKGLDLWIVADNLRKGAALNAIQIADLLISRHDL